jgi:hypothetical protein
MTSINAFFFSSYASANIATLFAGLPASGRQAHRASHGAITGSSAGTFVERATSTLTGGLSQGFSAALAQINFTVTSHGAQVTTASADTGLTGSSAQVAVSNTSSVTFSVNPSVQDLANEYAVLTNNDTGVVRPNVGPSPWVDALVGLAKGSDVALAVAAREALTNVVQAHWDADGHEIAYRDIGPKVKPNNLAHAAEYIASSDYAQAAIINIAKSIAEGEPPDAFLVNLLHARMNGSITVVDTKALSKIDNLDKYNTDYNEDYGYRSHHGRSFNFEVIVQPNSTLPLSSFSASIVNAAYREN